MSDADDGTTVSFPIVFKAGYRVTVNLGLGIALCIFCLLPLVYVECGNILEETLFPQIILFISLLSNLSVLYLIVFEKRCKKPFLPVLVMISVDTVLVSFYFLCILYSLLYERVKFEIFIFVFLDFIRVFKQYSITKTDRTPDENITDLVDADDTRILDNEIDYDDWMYEYSEADDEDEPDFF